MGWSRISIDDLHGCVMDPGIIFKTVLRSYAPSLIAAHNHPSGNCEPNQSNIALTNKLRDAGNFLDIQVLDYVILTSEGFYSFADEGII